MGENAPSEMRRREGHPARIIDIAERGDEAD